MRKYGNLTQWLERQPNDRVELTFEDIEDKDKIGVNLPHSARQHREWRANEADPKTRHFQSRAWTNAGWKVETVDIAKESVVFVRGRTRKATPSACLAQNDSWGSDSK